MPGRARLPLSLRLPRLWTLLLALNLLVLILPLAAFIFLRIYDRQLIRETESELFVQGAILVEDYRESLATALGVAAPRFTADHPSEIPKDGSTLRMPIDRLRDDAAEQPILPNVDDAIPSNLPASADDLLAANAARSLAPIIARAAEQTLAGIRIIDTRGVVIASSRSESGLSIGAREEVQQALRGEVATSLRRRSEKVRDAPLSSASRNTGIRVFVALPVFLEGKVRGAVVLARTPMTLGKAFYQDRYYLLITALAQILAVLALSLIAARVVIFPVRALADRASAIADGRDETKPLPPPRTYEIAALSDAVTRMGAALQQRADAIRAFAANVSHEFKTPLTSLSATVELLQDQLEKMEGPQRSRFLQILAADSARLNLLVDRLLELARAEVVRPGNVYTDVSTFIPELARRESSDALQIDVELVGHPRVSIAPELFEAIASNLIANARKHGGATKICIRAGAKINDYKIVDIFFENNGTPISSGNRERIVDPFFTTARAEGGTGMGLTIVQSLLKAHQGSIRLIESARWKPGGAAFLLELPAANASDA